MDSRNLPGTCVFALAREWPSFLAPALLTQRRNTPTLRSPARSDLQGIPGTHVRAVRNVLAIPRISNLAGLLADFTNKLQACARHMSHALKARVARERAIGKIALRAYWGVSRALSRLSTRRRSRKKAKPPARHSPGAEEGEFLFWLRSSRCTSKPQSGARSHRTAKLGTGVQLGAGFFRPPGKRCTARRGARR